MCHTKIFIKEELKLVNKQMNEKKSNIENKILEKVLQLWKQELGNKIKLIEPDSSKIFGKNKDNINGNKFDLDFDVSTISSRLADGIIDSCSCISDSSNVKRLETVQCCRPILSTPKISEEYNQTRNLEKV